VSALLIPATRVAAQGTTDAPRPSGAGPAAAVDYVGTVFDPAGGSFEFDVDARDLGVKRADNVRFAGKYSAVPCPDTHGTAHASVVVTVTTTSESSGFLESTQVELPIDVDVNDKAQVENVQFKGRFFDKALNPRGHQEDSRTRLDYDRALDLHDATVDNEGPFQKPVLQKRADGVESQAGALANKIAGKLAAIWQDGKTCVTLDVTPPSKSVKPKAKFDVDVQATSTKGGTAIARPITAKLDGQTSITPKTSRTAPTTFKYVAAKQNGQKGVVTFEQRSRRGIGRAQVEYDVGGKWKVDLSATKTLLACRVESPCASVGNLSGLSATIEIGADGSGTGTGTATLAVTSGSNGFPYGVCNVSNTYQVPMTVTINVVGDSLTVAARSNPDPALQYCGIDGPTTQTATTTLNQVTVPGDGSTTSISATDSTCLNSLGDAGADVRCTFTVTANKVHE